MELTAVPAFHACKHGSAAIKALTQQVFAAGFSQLQACQGDQRCSEAHELSVQIAQAARQMQRTLRLFLKRASRDSEVQLPGLGSVESILADHADAAAREVQQTLRAISSVHVSFGPNAVVFDHAIGLARVLRRREELLRWHLSFALLGLLWWQVLQLRLAGHSPALVPDSFELRLPELEFQEICCRVWDVAAALAEQTGGPGSSLAVLVGGATLSGELEAVLPVLRPGLSLVAVDFGAADQELSPGLVLLGCAAAGSIDDPELEFEQMSLELKSWGSGSGVPWVLGGCSFTASRSGLVEAVSRHAAQMRWEQK
ncbi:unnamed protein product [Polarella glacialis]|uniref:Uncharacterized protein n=1 Tax=Polarella glacialis TaxID=89957 RepID=A0A813FQ80_POLGL|nr:unnamed protein product [Polarella glacialis]